RSTPSTSGRLDTTPTISASSRPSAIRSIRFCMVVPPALMRQASFGRRPAGMGRGSFSGLRGAHVFFWGGGPGLPGRGDTPLMEPLLPELPRRFDGAAPLGYSNFSDGRPDPKFRKSLADVFGFLAEAGDRAPWQTALAWLTARADELEK